MPEAKVIGLLDEAAEIGVRTLSFSGGEPFIHPHFRRFLNHAIDLGFSVEIVTNGTMVQPEDIPTLEKLKCVTVSVDGTEPVHDTIRGVPGTWLRTMETIALLGQSRAVWGVNTVIQALNHNALHASWREILARGRPHYISLTHVEVIPETGHLVPSAEQNVAIKAQIARIRAECEEHCIHFNDELMVDAFFDLFADKSRRFRPLGGCPIPQTFLGVSSYGIFPCWHQGRALPQEGLIEALSSELCQEIIDEGLERRCIGCNAANYSWSKEWVDGAIAAAAANDFSEGLVHVSAADRSIGGRPEGSKQIPLLDREERRARKAAREGSGAA